LPGLKTSKKVWKITAQTRGENNEAKVTFSQKKTKQIFFCRKKYQNFKERKRRRALRTPLQTFDFWISVLVILANVSRNISKYWKSESFVWFGQDFKTGFDALNADTFYHKFYRYDQIWLLRMHTEARNTVMDLLKQL